MLTTALGHSRLLARPGDRRLCLLDAGASALWDLQATGLTPADLTELLVARFALPPEQARTQVAALMNDWRHAGLLDADEAAANWRLGAPDDPVWPAPRPRPLEPAAWALQVADRRVGLSAEDATVRRHLNALLVPATRVGEPCEVDHALQLRGSTKAWQLALEGAPLEQGQGLDAALIATLATLTELGCRPAERLIVLHGAGLVTADGRGLLLVAPGGSGKTTLAAALEASGYGLLSDDVVPVGWDGALWGLGLPLCLKPGSWPVLTARRPTLARMPTRHRFGTEVRFLPALHPRPVRAASVGALFLSQYRPDAPPECVPIGPEQALRGLIEAESVLRDLTQEKLDALARWISAIAAYRLQYPDLDQAHALIETRLRPQAPPRRPSDHR